MNALSQPTEHDTLEAITDEVSAMFEALGRRCSPVQLAMYTRVLSDVPHGLVGDAVAHALRGSREHPPTPGQLREIALTAGRGYAGLADEAWLVFARAVSTLGGDRSVSFRDGLINATVRLLGGWVQCSQRVGDDFEKWLKRDFLATYARLCQTGASAELRRGFVGRLRIANARYSDAQLRMLPGADCGLAEHSPDSPYRALAAPEATAPVGLLTDQRDGDVEHPVAGRAGVPSLPPKRAVAPDPKRATVDELLRADPSMPREVAERIASASRRAADSRPREREAYRNGEQSPPTGAKQLEQA